MATQIREASTSFAATPVEGKPGRFLIDLITPGWGSSGYYSADVLEQAATDNVFAAGLHMHIDHQSLEEQYAQPAGSLKDFAAVLGENAVWTGTALAAQVNAFSPYAPLLKEMKDHIGVSIRAGAEVSQGEAEGRKGQIIERIVEASSVDFVTHAGRGGRIVEVLESALGDTLTHDVAMARLAEARNIGQWLESRLHLELTTIADEMFGDGRLTREERISMSSAIGQALTTFASQLEDEQPQLYSRDLWEEPTAFLVAAETSDVPSIPVGQPTTQESSGGQMATTQIEESALSELREAAGRVSVLENERDAEKARADKAEGALEESKAATKRAADADSIIAAVATEHAITFDGLQVAGLKAALPVKEGALDTEAFTTTVKTHAAKLAEANGAGSMFGFGVGAPAPTEGLSESELHKSLGITVNGA